MTRSQEPGWRQCILPIALLLATMILALSSATAATFSCDFKASCSGSELGMLRVSNQSGSFNNSHAQLMNYSGTAYDFTLCCSTDVNHSLSNNCSNSTTTPVLRLSNVSDAHVQVPSVNTYTYSACFGAQPDTFSCQYVNTTCSAGFSPVMSIASSEANGNLSNMTNAHIGNYSHYTLNVCCKINNSPPTVPTLIYPANNNNSVFERRPNFNWTTSSDPDNDPITYELNITSATCTDYNPTGITDSNYTSAELCVDVLYNWTVRACDASACSAWATQFNFTIASVLGVVFTANQTDFGAPALGASDDTTDGSPAPFIVENTGNIVVNVTFRANDSLFDSEGLGNTSFQYKARANESNAFNTSASQMTFTPVTANYTNLFITLDYQDSQDAGYVDIGITVPTGEPPGAKDSIVQILGAT